jgi:RNA-directed DNA polymerase
VRARANCSASGTEGRTSTTDWNAINWREVEKSVSNLRRRIFRASKEGDHRKVRSLQKLALRSHANALLSVRRVTQINAGRNTPGVDKLVVKTPKARSELVDHIRSYQPWKARPARRVYIPKANGKMRSLGIPTIHDRVMQAIVKNALEPYWEAHFEPASSMASDPDALPRRHSQDLQHRAPQQAQKVGPGRGHRRSLRLNLS